MAKASRAEPKTTATDAASVPESARIYAEALASHNSESMAEMIRVSMPGSLADLYARHHIAVARAEESGVTLPVERVYHERVTLGGRAIAVALMLAGVGLVATLAASVAAYFVGKEEEGELLEVRQRLQHMEATLDEINRRLSF